MARGHNPTLVGTASRFRHGVAGMVAGALGLRVAVVLATPGFVPHSDAADYDRIAVSLAVHGTFPTTLLAAPGGPTAYRPPLFPGLLSLVDRAVGSGVPTTRWEAGRLVEAALGAIAVLLVCVIAARLWGRRVGLVAGAIAAVFPPLVLAGSSLLSESLFIPLVLAATWAALRSRDQRGEIRWALLAGALAGLGALTRANGVALVIPLGLLVWPSRPKPFTAPLALVATTAVILVPWTVRDALTMHAIVPISTESGYVVDGTYNATVARDTRFPGLWAPPVAQLHDVLARHPGDDEHQVSGALDHQGFHYALAHPAFVGRVVFWGAVRTMGIAPGFERAGAVDESYPVWLVDLSIYAYWVVGLLALAGVLIPTLRRGPAAFWGVPVTIVLSFIFVEGSIRFRSPADPFVVMLAAATVTWITGPRSRTARRDTFPGRSAVAGPRRPGLPDRGSARM
jgi:4-amino-4-deoxy-L-arabinose transferase-like glycosyltransferase